MISLQNISKNYDETTVLKNIELKIKESSTTILIGPSGCGKSTLIRIIAGLIEPDSGEVKIQDQQISKTNINEIRKNLGYVIQEGGLFPHLSGYENVTLMANYLQYDKGKIDKRIAFLNQLTNLDDSLLNKYPSQLSGGQRQRISLMRALMLNPQILLLDEPLGALDPLIRFDLQTELKQIFSKLNKTVIMVTHDLSEAIYFGDEIVLMKDGVIVQKDSPEELIKNPKNDFVEKFITAQRSHTDFQ